MASLPMALTYENLFLLTVRSLDKVDEHLSGHGVRAAYRVKRAAKMSGKFSDISKGNRYRVQVG